MVFAERYIKNLTIMSKKEQEEILDEEDKEIVAEQQPEQEAATDDNEQADSDPLEAAQKEIESLKDQLLRKAAEFENFRKRTIKEKTELILNGGESTVKAVLPILDDFERALADQTDDATAFREGMELIFKKFVSTLEGIGVKKIDTTDQDFNVDYHEAVAMVPGMGDDKKGKVIDCIQTGYTMNDKVIRHAKVAVGQ